MAASINFGVDDSCRLALDEFTLLAPDVASTALVADPAAAIRGALAQPLDYPPLSAATVPGDRVAVALDSAVPCAGPILKGTIEALEQAGVDLSLVTVVVASSPGELSRLKDELAIDVGRQISFEHHAPDDEKALAMVAMTAAGRPLRFNRTLAESDVLLPILAARLASHGPAKYAGLFPQFSNCETLERFRAPVNGGAGRRRVDHTAEINESGWLLGAGMTAAVVPGPGGGVAAVLAGDPECVARDAAQRFRDIWVRPSEQQGDLVIAALAGDESEQTWENLARALTASERVLRPDGAIVVCSNLAVPPGKSLNRLIDAMDLDLARRQLRRDSAEDARPARALAKALERGPVYLKSCLPAELVESLGMTPIENDAELSRLAATRRHCVVIEEAQRVRPRFVGDSG